MHDNLPDVRLTPTVVQRIQGRLLGLFGGVTAKGLNYSIPSVLRRAYVPKFMGTSGTKKRMKCMEKKKKELKRVLRRKSLGLPINKKDLKILKRKRYWIEENSENPDVKREQDLSPVNTNKSRKRVREPECFIPV